MEAGLTAVYHWDFAQKLVFRFFATYFFIFLFPFPIGYLPFTDSINSWYNDLWDPLVYRAGCVTNEKSESSFKCFIRDEGRPLIYDLRE
ncbi:MAG: hypothetical protein ABIO56_05605 [Ferruginibacter sp.]